MDLFDDDDYDFDMENFNHSYFNIDNDFNSEIRNVKALQCISIGICGTIAVILNAIFIWYKLSNPAIKTAKDILFANLVIANFLFVVINSPVYLYQTITDNFPVDSDFMCKFFYFIGDCFLFVENYNIVLILINYAYSWKIQQKESYPRKSSNINLIYCILFLWFGGFVASLLNFRFVISIHLHGIEGEPIVSCLYRENESNYDFLIELAMTSYLPFLLSFLFFICFLWIALPKRKSLPIDQRRNIYMVILIVLSHLILSLPFGFFMFFIKISNNFNLWWIHISFVCKYLNFCVKPIIFYFLWSDFRVWVQKVFGIKRNTNSVEVI